MNLKDKFVLLDLDHKFLWVFLWIHPNSVLISLLFKKPKPAALFGLSSKLVNVTYLVRGEESHFQPYVFCFYTIA